MTAETKIGKGVSSAVMREIDSKAFEDYGIPSIILMENAGRAVAEAALSFNSRRIAVLCGSANNGGDGLVAARYLSQRGKDVEIILLKDSESFRGDTLINYRIAANLKIPVRRYGLHTPLRKFQLIIDALLGTGAKGKVSGHYRDAIAEINGSKRKTLSVDIPSGLDADTGKMLGIAVEADMTITMAIPKVGLLKPAAKPFVGKLLVADIGIPRQLLAQY